MTSIPTSFEDNPFSYRLPFGLSVATTLLILIVLIAAGLRMVQPELMDAGNTYYTAAAKNMLQSPANFFFGVADAGGVTIDKPPVAMWLQAASGAIFGINGLAVTLPSILSGVLSVLILYRLVTRSFGIGAGLIAAFVLAVMPVSVAVDRTNNFDSVLNFTLLLATWAFIRATNTGRWRDLMLGAVIVGVAFNVKMLQAYLILPALYALYFLGASVAWRKKMMQLIVTTFVLVLVSFSWAVAVDLTPPENRPYIGGSETNSVLNLIFGYNGLGRLSGEASRSGLQNNQLEETDDEPLGEAEATLEEALVPRNVNEIGVPGILRLFQPQLQNEASWLLPFALMSMGLLAIRRIRLPLGNEHQALVLWGGWLLLCAGFFSVAGFFHAYYLATMAPAIAALTGIGSKLVWDMMHEKPLVGIALASVMFASTVGFQIYTVTIYSVTAWYYAAPAIIGAVISIVGLIGFLIRRTDYWKYRGISAYIAGLLVVPAMWGGLTVAESGGQLLLPNAADGIPPQSPVINVPLAPIADAITQNDTVYDLVVDSALLNANIIINTELSVLYLGGFNGYDRIYTLETWRDMVDKGMVRYVFTSGRQDEVSHWTSEQCMPVELDWETPLAAAMAANPEMNQFSVPEITTTSDDGVERTLPPRNIPRRSAAEILETINPPNLYDCAVTS